MLRPRIVPCLLVSNGGLVKTTRFSEPKYVGDPLNAVRIFNEKNADELIVLDIDATRLSREADYRLIANIANECRMPLCYGGGIRTVEQIEKVVSLGVEKVAISSAAIEIPALISDASLRVGRQSVIVVIDVRKVSNLRGYEVVTRNGSVLTGLDPIEFAQLAEARGAGEIVLNSIDRDGTGQGFDLELATRLRRSVSVPISILGGAGSLSDVERLLSTCGVVGAVAGSLFVFKGRYRAVLINYPTELEKEELFTRAKA